MNKSSMRRTWRAVGTGLVVATAALAPLPSPAAASEPYCGIEWGSRRERDLRHTSATISNLRAGRHECFDRLVVDLGPPDDGLPGPQAEGYTVRYVRQVVDDPSGRPIRLDGGAFLEVIIRARALDENMNPTYDPPNRRRAVDVEGFSTFRQVRFLGTHEELTQIGLGVRARLPFRVLVLDGPGDGSRIVIDVAHHW